MATFEGASGRRWLCTVIERRGDGTPSRVQITDPAYPGMGLTPRRPELPIPREYVKYVREDG